MGWILLKGGHVFDPEDRGIADVLILDDRIAAVGRDLPAPTGIGEGEIVSVADRIVLPGLIDGHIHVMGASGLGGPLTRSPDLQIERIAGVGVTTVVSPLGADCLSRSIPCLLARAAALECEGISAYCCTGGWKLPVPTLTGDPQADIAYVDRVVGIKVAISEPLAPLYGMDELCRLAHAAFTGGRLAGKRAVLHAHVGDHPEGLMPLREVQRRTGVPHDRLLAIHVNRNPGLWKQAMEYARDGGSIDLTAMQRPETGHPSAIRPAEGIREALAAGVPAPRITLSTDSGVPYPRLDATGQAVGLYMAGPESILVTVRELVDGGMSWGQAVAFAGQHVADLLGLRRKGRIAAGRDGDLLVLTPAGDVDRVYARGRLLVDRGTPMVLGAFGGHRSPG
jgi:beta-aspartyl-dipeptidase (metallo-type)